MLNISNIPIFTAEFLWAKLSYTRIIINKNSYNQDNNEI